MTNRVPLAAICMVLALSSISRAASVEVVDFVSSTTKADAFIPAPVDAAIYPFIAGRHIDVGTVTVFSTPGGQLVVTYQTTNGWSIEETHLEIALQPKDFPQTKSGNPTPGRFDYGGRQNSGTTAVQYVFDWGPLAPAGTVVHVAAHGVVTGNGTETAWSAGTQFAGRNWFTYSTYVRPASDQLALEKTFLPRDQYLGGDGNFSIEVTNTGSVTAATVEVSDLLDPIFQIVHSANVEVGTGICSVVGRSLSCSVTSLGVGETAVIHVYYCLLWDPDRNGDSVENCATATDSNGNSARGCDTVNLGLGDG